MSEDYSSAFHRDAMRRKIEERRFEKIISAKLICKFSCLSIYTRDSSIYKFHDILSNRSNDSLTADLARGIARRDYMVSVPHLLSELPKFRRNLLPRALVKCVNF